MKCYLDSETCGLHGVAVLLQYAWDDGPIELHDVWLRPMGETMELIEKVMENDLIGFNLAFDHFHLCKLYTMFGEFGDYNAIPKDHVEALAKLEPQARFGPCLKPKRALDLMLHARKGPYQSLMAREDVRIKKVPRILAQRLADELEQRIQMDGIYFARRKDKYAPKWMPYDIEGEPNFQDVVLRFAPKGDLKTLAKHALKIEDSVLLRYTDVEIDHKLRPEEMGWAPFALAVGRPGRWKGAWPEVLKFHIDHWQYRRDARKYAEDDVIYTRGLEKHFGSPEPGDDDSELACMVAAVRWHGFNVDLESMQKQKVEALKKAAGVPTAPGAACKWIQQVMDDSSKKIMGKATDKVMLTKLATGDASGCDCTFDDDLKNQDCPLCNNTRKGPWAERAGAVLTARKGLKEAELYDKIIAAARFHASFIVIGTLSSRMAGADGLNPQGINRATEVRRCFIFADPGFVLCGGDFDSFEVVLADAAYNDPALRRALQQGKSIHALFGAKLYPDQTYESIIKSKGSKVQDYYTIAKSSVFAMIYGGDDKTLVGKYQVDPAIAEKAYKEFLEDYPEVGKSRQKIFDAFCSMQQPRPGGPVVWHEPAEYIESLQGFRRYFTLENEICRALFTLGENPPQEWVDLKIKCVRREGRTQFVGGATRSALFGAAFAIQAAAMRAAANHVIQSSGATITKKVQRRVWDFQPCGVHPWMVVPCNIHDEVLAPCRPEIAEAVQAAVYATIETFRPQVPLIAMTWKIGMKSWAEK